MDFACISSKKRVMTRRSASPRASTDDPKTQRAWGVVPRWVMNRPAPVQIG